MTDLHVWFEPRTTPTVDSGGRVPAADALPSTVVNLIKFFYEAKVLYGEASTHWTDYFYAWVRPAEGATFSEKEVDFLEWLAVLITKNTTLAWFLSFHENPDYAIIVSRRSVKELEKFRTDLRRKCSEVGVKLKVSEAPDLPTFCRESAC